MKRIKTLSAMITLGFLVACGGGGSDDPNRPPVKVVDHTNPNPPKPAPSAQQDVDPEYMIYQNGRRIDDDNDERYRQTQLNVMNLDGRNLEIIPTGSIGSIVTTNEGSTGIKRTVGGADLQYARFGVISYTQEGKDYIFHQGVETAERDMPRVGTANYTGNAVGYRTADGFVETGTANFTANFVTKKMTKADINFKTLGQFSLKNARIDDDEFEGRNGSLKMEGNFYGQKAAELAGKFSDTSKGVVGVFGAKKQ